MQIHGSRGRVEESSQGSSRFVWMDLQQGYESAFINEIVGELSARVVNPSYELPVADHPVGIESCRREIESLLDVGEKNAVRTVGIWGTGGIGKTTIAKAVYNSIYREFDGSCFLANVGSNSKSLTELQGTSLSRILRDPTLKVQNVDEGISFIKQRMPQKKVLLVLDDVSDSNQLKKLAPSSDCFGAGSRIIITTRDQRWLTAHRVPSIYEVKMLDNDRALELFSLNAFRRNGPPDDYLKLAKRAVRYAQGLPLALIVLGSHLFDRGSGEWEAILNSCKGDPQREIQSVLKISFDALNDCAKELFLDIACFFKGKEVDDVTPILQACGRNPAIGMKLLVEKALIRIDRYRIWMHDLIEEMGKDIVLQEGEPSERSRLWNWDDIHLVLTDNTGTKKIKGIRVQQRGDEICLNSASFSEMKSLIYLSSCKGVHYSGNIDCLSNNLRWLNWLGCPIQSFPSNFHPQELVALNILDSCHITRLWEGRKIFRNLTSMNLSRCASLMELPDFTGILNLKELTLEGCESLVEVHDSVGSLDRLETLNANHCSKLIRLPRKISSKFMRTISLSNCKRLGEFPKIAVKIDSLRDLDLSFKDIKELDSSIGNLIGLENLSLCGCENLSTLPCSIYGLQHLEKLNLSECSKLVTFPTNTKSLHDDNGDGSLSLPKLKELKMKGCNLSNCDFLMTLDCLDTLTELDLSSNSFVSLPACISKFVNLEKLDLHHCNRLREIPELPPKLVEIEVHCCKSPEKFSKLSEVLEGKESQGIKWMELKNCHRLCDNLGYNMDKLERILLNNQSFLNLTSMNLSGCVSLMELPDFTRIPNLKELTLEGCESLVEVHDSVRSLDRLETLNANHCSKLITLPREISLKSVHAISLVHCKRLEEFPKFTGNMDSLSCLDLSGSGIKELHPSIGNLIGLKVLHLHRCENLSTLPCSIDRLQNLEMLDLSGCSKLTTFPEINRKMDSLQQLHLSGSGIKELHSSIGHLFKIEIVVSIELCREEINALLDVGENDVRMVGIWGTGGIGKTTIAKYVYNSIRHKYDSSCFLAVDGTNSSHDQSLAKLQETLLFKILGDPTLKVDNVDEGISFIKKKMQQKKVLLILDDVSDFNQIKKLAPSPDCFGAGSRIIIVIPVKVYGPLISTAVSNSVSLSP